MQRPSIVNPLIKPGIVKRHIAESHVVELRVAEARGSLLQRFAQTVIGQGYCNRDQDEHSTQQQRYRSWPDGVGVQLQYLVVVR